MNADTHPTAFEATIPGNPRPKERPRVVNRRAYTPTRTADYEAEVAIVAKQSWRGRDLMRGRLAVTLRFFRRNRTVCDIDNLCKSILDGLQGVVFKDDNQIDLLHAERDIDKEDPRVEVLIEQL